MTPSSSNYVHCIGGPPEVDFGSTDNTFPRDGNCVFNALHPSGQFDGSTGSADFEYANVISEPGSSYPLAELAYARVGSDSAPFAMIHAATLRDLALGVTPPAAGASMLNGDKSTRFYDLFESVFTSFYAPKAQLRNCEKGGSNPGNCPSYANPTDATDYRMKPHCVDPMGDPVPRYQLQVVFGHQDGTSEVPPGCTIHGDNNPFDPLGCPDMSPPNLSYTERQRIQFLKGCNPSCTVAVDVQAPIYTSNFIEDMQGMGTPPDLAPGLWFFSGSDAGSYNYRNRILREPLLGPDSSFLSTIIPSGAAGFVIRTTVNPFPPGVYLKSPNIVSFLTRELYTGRTLGEAMRDIGNKGAVTGFMAGTRFLYQYDHYAFGDPDFRLNRTGGPGTNATVILAAPGPGLAGSSPSEVRGFRADGVQTLSFAPYMTVQKGANLAGGQIDATPNDEILTGPGYGPNFGPQVKAFVWDGAPIPKVNFFAYGTLKFGVNVGTVDYDRDAIKEILTTPGPGAVFGPHVRIFNYDGVSVQPKVSFFAFGGVGNFGASAAGGEILPSVGDAEDVVVGHGADPTFGSDIQVFAFTDTSSATPQVVQTNVSGFALPAVTSYGVHLVTSEFDAAPNGAEDIIVAAGPGPANAATLAVFGGGENAPLGAPEVTIADAFGDGALFGARVGATNTDADYEPEILVSRGWNTTAAPNSEVLVLDGPCASQPCTSLPVQLQFQAFAPDTTGGLSVSGITLAQGGLPKAFMDMPLEAIQPIDPLIQDAEAEAFVSPSSRDMLLGVSANVSSALEAGHLVQALDALQTLRGMVQSEVASEFFRNELTVALDEVGHLIELALSNHAPTAVISGVTEMSCPGRYTFTAEDSTDPDDRGPDTQEIESYAWTLDGVPLQQFEQEASIDLTTGSHTIGLEIHDTFGASSTATQDVTVADHTPPVAQLTLTPSTLWPPNHSMATITATLAVGDNCGGRPTFSLVSVTSNEPETGCGSGNTSPDVMGADVRTPDTIFQVRAERCGSGGGRHYTVTYDVRDSAGNTTRVHSDVVVPHNQ